MSWNTLSKHAQQLGFKLAYRTRTATGGGYLPEMTTPPATEGPWLCLGSYEQVAGLWLSPVTAAARNLSREHLATLMEDCDPFIGTVGVYDSEFFAATAPGRAAVDHPESGMMPPPEAGC